MDTFFSASTISESKPLNHRNNNPECSRVSDSNNYQEKGGEDNFSSRKKKRRRGRNRPYSAKNFLGRPKINAPANTTQFLCADKEYYSENTTEDDTYQLNVSTSNSESESSFNTSSSAHVTVRASSIYNDDDASYQSLCLDDERFLTEEFDQVYDDIRAELLRNQSVEELSSRCMELESAIHNLQYLLQKETEKRHQIEQFLYFTEWNSKLSEENQRLQQTLNSSVAEEHELTNNLNEISINNADQTQT